MVTERPLPLFPKIRFYTDHLPSHGVRPYYSWGVRVGDRYACVCVGGYKLDRFVTRYRRISTSLCFRDKFVLVFGRKSS